MAVTYNKPKNMRYVDMCIFIDAHFPEVQHEGENPQLEATIYEYIYHVIYALSFKKMFFNDFKHYDSFALYGAAEVYMAMRKKLEHQGEYVHGKPIVPVKSVLNFIKAVLFPLKVEYQNNTYSQIWNPEIGQDTEPLYEDMKEIIQSDYRRDFLDLYDEAVREFPKSLRSIILRTPYGNDPLMVQRLTLSCMLTFLDELTLSRIAQTRANLLSNKIKTSDDVEELDMIYRANKGTAKIILWHLPEEFRDFVAVLVAKLKQRLSADLGIAFHETDLSEALVDKIMQSAYATREDDDTND